MSQSYQPSSEPIPAHRRAMILERLRTLGSVSINDLADYLQVSASTVRRDLDELMQEGALERFLELLEGEVKALRVGDPLDEATQMGPLISRAQHEIVASFLEDGAPVAFRGSAPEGPGFWFAPTVLAPVSPGERVAREEVFGPIAAVIPFADEAEAVRIANDTIYGLSGSIWTRDGARALRVARAIDSGVLSINSNTSVRVATPFGGFKQSGYGRELGPHALDAYTEVKSIYYSTSS